MLANVIKAINKSPNQVRGITILEEGEQVAEHNWEADQLTNLHSIGKCFLSTAAGFAIDEGLIELGQTVSELFPEYVTPTNEEVLSKLTVHHLLSMGVGQAQPHLMMDQRDTLDAIDWVEYALDQPFDYEPGEQFVYSNVGPYLVGVYIQREANQNLVEYLKPRLFDPLEISEVKWEKNPLGYTFASGGLQLKRADLVKFAELYLQNGKWHGEQLLPARWDRQSTRQYIRTDSETDDAAYYGYGFWVSADRKMYRADGANGQLAVVIPEKDRVIVVTSEAADNGELMNILIQGGIL